MVAATIALAAMHGCVRYLSDQLDVYTITFFRNFFGLVTVLPLVMRSGIMSLATTRIHLHALRGVTGILAMLLWFTALARVEIATATALSFTAALFTTLAAVIFLGERLRFRRIVAIIVGIIGVLIVLRPAGDSFDMTALLVLASTMFWGTNVVIVKTLSQTDRTASIVAWSGIFLTTLSLPLWIIFGEWPTTPQLMVLLAIGAFGTAGHLLITAALKMADSSAVMSLDFLRLIWSVIIGVWFFSDGIDFWTIVGACVIFASGLYILVRESRQSIQATDPQAVVTKAAP